MDTFEVCISWIVTCFTQSFETCLHQGTNATTQNCLFTEQVGFCFCSESCLQKTSSCSTDCQTISQCSFQSFSCSILFYSYAYCGGAHGSLTTFARNYSAKTGNVLTMKDFGEEVSSLVTDNAVKFINAIQDTDDAFFYDKVKATDESVQSMLETGSFYLSKDGLVLIDGQYLLQPYAAGIVEFTTSYDDLRGKLNDEYSLPGGVTNCVSAMGAYTFDQDGKLTRTESSYDPADMPKGDDMPEATSGADTSTSSN